MYQKHLICGQGNSPVTAKVTTSKKAVTPYKLLLGNRGNNLYIYKYVIYYIVGVPWYPQKFPDSLVTWLPRYPARFGRIMAWWLLPEYIPYSGATP